PAVLAAYREDVPDVCAEERSKMDPNTPFPTLSGWCSLLDNALQTAVAGGNLNAMIALGVHMMWGQGAADGVNSYAYIYAAAQGLEVSAGQGVQTTLADGDYQTFLQSERSKYQEWLAALGKRLSSDQLEKARSQADEILSGTSSCC